MAVVAPLAPETDPGEAGLDPRQLRRLDEHFEAYVTKGRLPGYVLVVTRGGRVAYLAAGGYRDVEAQLPMTVDTVFRIYSMTKPITSVVAMQCYEEGRLRLDDPVGKYIPAFESARVFVGGSSFRPVTVPATEPVRIWHLLTHTAGLTYGFHYAHTVDAMYRAAGFEWGYPRGMDLASACDAWARLPLLFQPGTEWNYSVATDVLGRVIEVVTGEPLDQAFRTRVFEPLGMHETAFSAAGDLAERLAALYVPDPLRDGALRRDDRVGSAATRTPSVLSGGGGLVSTPGDYHRFTQMLLGHGALGGVRALGSRTVDFMTRNHLPGGADLQSFGRPIGGDVSDAGVGFGLGFSVTVDPVARRLYSTPGEYGWGGAASTTFFVDPTEELTLLFFTQLMPSTTYPLRAEIRQLLYPALR